VVSPEQFQAADVSPEARPGQLGLSEWVRLAAVVAASPRTSTPTTEGGQR
jgi:hypothetical protein